MKKSVEPPSSFPFPPFLFSSSRRSIAGCRTERDADGGSFGIRFSVGFRLPSLSPDIVDPDDLKMARQRSGKGSFFFFPPPPGNPGGPEPVQKRKDEA